MLWKACKIKFEREPDLGHCLSQKSHHGHQVGHDLTGKPCSVTPIGLYGSGELIC